VADDLILRELARDDWPGAMQLVARSYLSEPFMIEMFGTEPVRRFALANDYYRSSPWQADHKHPAAYVGDRLVGFCISCSPCHCHVCTDTDPQRPPDDPLHVADWQFKLNVKAAHADYDAHAWISRVVVDSVLQGAGIGRTLMSQALAELRSDGAETVLLECQVHREGFYAACGFQRVRTFPDPLGPDAVLMSADLRP
jgi:ribosomal protein S18 acetylase RimI-like enzyme